MRRIIVYARRYLLQIVWIVLCSLGCSLANVYLVDIVKEMVDSTLSGGGNMPLGFLEMLVKAAVVILIGMLSNYMVVRGTGMFGARILRDLRRDAVEHIAKLSPDFLEKHNFGDIMERLSSDTATIATYMQTYFKDYLYAPVMVLVFAGYLFSMNGWVAAACLGPLLIMVPLSVKLLQPVKQAQAEYVKKLGFTNNHIQGVFDGSEVMKSYRLEKKLRKQYYGALKETLDISLKNDLRQYNIEPLSALIKEAPRAVTLCLGGYLALQGRVTLGVLVAFLSGIDKINEPLVYAYQLVIRTKMAMVSMERILEVLDMPVEGTPEILGMSVEGASEEKGALPEKATEVFRFEGVDFSYGTSGFNKKPVLKQLELSVEAGKRIALVGASGSGKSTILKLMCRQYEATGGEIYFYGKAFSGLEPRAVRDELALISQEAVLFPMSIGDNIRIGKADATGEEVEQAARLSGCHGFISALPEGYDTLLEEKGNNLSGGQRQRIAIARAILKNAPILLLDEPTSALDRETERYVMETINRISVDKTVITVAHRLNTIVDYDEIIVLECGQIAERGTHEALMDKRGRYYALYTEYTLTGGAEHEGA